MTLRLMTEHHSECLSLKVGCTGSSESTIVKCHIVGNLMSRLKYRLFWLPKTVHKPMCSYMSFVQENAFFTERVGVDTD